MTKKKNLENYMISCIDFDGYNANNFITDEKNEIECNLKNLYKRFLNEQDREEPTVQNIKQRLLRLPIFVDYTYFDIANRLKECGYKKTENQKYQDQYYRKNMARMIYKDGQ